MTGDKAFISTTDLTKKITESIQGMETGKTSLAALEELITDIRELEERIIVIRYKGMERLRMEDVPVILDAPIVTVPGPEIEVPVSPPSPLAPIMEQVTEAVNIPDNPQVQEPPSQIEAPSSNQISLIDSIEELSKDIVKDEPPAAISTAENHKKEVPVKPLKKTETPVHTSKTGLSYAEKMEKRPVSNIKKELNLNQRLGLARVLAPGDDKGLDRILAEVDETQNMEQAVSLLKGAAGDRWENAQELMEELTDIVQRKFL